MRTWFWPPRASSKAGYALTADIVTLVIGDYPRALAVCSVGSPPRYLAVLAPHGELQRRHNLTHCERNSLIYCFHSLVEQIRNVDAIWRVFLRGVLPHKEISIDS